MPHLQRLLTGRGETVRLTPLGLARLHELAWKSFPNETGGVLLGRRTEADGLGASVEHIVGPGPSARHERARFVPDSRWQAHEVEALWRQDQGLQYLGDWHTHPGGSAIPSAMDKDALGAIAAFADARQAAPVMVILALQPARTRIGATVLTGGRFESLKVGLADG